jgi:hypothetical protein
MTEINENGERDSTRARQYFFIPIDEATIFAKLDVSIARALPGFAPITKAFRHNLTAVISTVSVPFHLIAAHVQGLRFQQIHLAESIRAQGIEGEGTVYEKALPIARERFSKEITEPEMIRQFSNQTLRELEQSLERGDLARAASELLRQGIVAVWGALEVLAQDVFVALLNANPKYAVQLLTHERTKHLFQLKAIPLDTLSNYDFDLSGSFGDILIRYRRVDTIPVIQAVFNVLLPKSENLRNALGQRDLWVLNQRRHLIVHRRGIVDAEYIAKTGESLTPGTVLVIRPDDLERYLQLTTDAGQQLINDTCLQPE